MYIHESVFRIVVHNLFFVADNNFPQKILLTLSGKRRNAYVETVGNDVFKEFMRYPLFEFPYFSISCNYLETVARTPNCSASSSVTDFHSIILNTLIAHRKSGTFLAGTKFKLYCSVINSICFYIVIEIVLKSNFFSKFIINS